MNDSLSSPSELRAAFQAWDRGGEGAPIRALLCRGRREAQARVGNWPLCHPDGPTPS